MLGGRLGTGSQAPDRGKADTRRTRPCPDRATTRERGERKAFFMAYDNAVQLALTGRAAVYKTLHAALANEPDTQVMALLAGDDLVDVLGAFGIDKTAALDAKVRAGEVLAGGQDALDALEGSYNRLFVGPTILEAGPWESLYKTTDNVLFCETTLEVRKAYVAQGFIPNNYPHVSDDHVALELDFMRLLAQQTLEACEAGDLETARAKLAAQADFLAGHLNVWLPKFAKKVAAAEHGGFYGPVAVVAREWARFDAELIQELQAAL